VIRLQARFQNVKRRFRELLIQKCCHRDRTLVNNNTEIPCKWGFTSQYDAHVWRFSAVSMVNNTTSVWATNKHW
jgi:hypothetical protein